MKFDRLLILILLLQMSFSCTEKKADQNRKPLLEVEGKFLYLDQVQEIIPPNVNAKDSAEIADNFIRKWVTDVLIYQNAKRNITNKREIDQLLEEYEKSLTIQQYQQNLIAERLPKEPSDAEMKAFYDKYSDQLKLSYNIVQGFLLIVPAKAPKLETVRSWVQSGNANALGSIEKYSIQNAISYDYFGDKWIPLGDILRKMPLQVEDPASFLSGRRFVEASDSTRRYFLRINSYKLSGQVEPYDMAKPKIASIILNKLKTDFISKFEDDIYNDAVKNGDITYYNKKR